MKLFFRIALLLSLGGCAYYNGLYNANKLVREARKAEREGRVGEARSMWSQVIVKTDTVLARYPDSDYRDDALFLKGLALTELDACWRAFEPLTAVVDSSPDPRLTGMARVRMAKCYLGLDHPDSVFAILGALPDSESEFRDEALWVRGRAHYVLSSPEAALVDLEATGSDSAAFDLALTRLALGDPDGARAALVEVFDRSFDEPRWFEVLDSLASYDRTSASEVTDELVVRRDITRGERARLLIADGRRVEGFDRVLAANRYQTALETAGDSVEADIARVQLVLLRLRETSDTAVIRGAYEDLSVAASRGGEAARQATPALAAVTAFLADTIPGPTSDVTRFLVAEMIRDSIGAVELASAMFRGVADDYPGSVIAPKALIAAGVGSSGPADVLATLRRLYPRSPYTLALMGIDSPRYAAVEDSLSRLGLNSNGLPQGRRRTRVRGDVEEVN